MVPAPVGHQCPTCVGEARGEFRRGAGRRMSLAGFSVTKLMLAAIVAVFVIEIAEGGSGSLVNGPSASVLARLGASVPGFIAEGQWWRLLSAMFLHAGLFHIALNGYALWIFGTQVERDFGKARFLAIYFVSGFMGSVASYFFAPLTLGALFTVGVGASGAIVGLLGAFIAYNYRRRDTRLARANLQWAIMLIVLNAVLGQAIAGVDNIAHLGGLVAGGLCGLLADRTGPEPAQRAMRWAGYAFILVVGIAMTVAHTNAINHAFPGLVRLLPSR